MENKLESDEKYEHEYELKQLKNTYKTKCENKINNNCEDYNYMCDKILYKYEESKRKINDEYDLMREKLKINHEIEQNRKLENEIEKSENEIEKSENELVNKKNKLDSDKKEYHKIKRKIFKKIQKLLRKSYFQDKNIFPFFESKCYFWYTNSCLVFKTLNDNIDFETDVVIAKYTNSTVLPLSDDDKKLCEIYGFKVNENVNELETFLKEYEENQKKFNRN